jgi:cob(I)alamin adenosyltransferase
MKIYTKTGDRGETALSGGRRVQKNELRIQVYGTIDETNSVIGLALSHSGLPDSLKQNLTRIQSELFQLGAELAAPHQAKIAVPFIGDSQIEKLESEIDEMELKNSPLKNFILPGGSPTAATLHLARTVVRRGERELITLHQKEALRTEVLVYVNRLSDYLFVAARFVNANLGVSETPWKMT